MATATKSTQWTSKTTGKAMEVKVSITHKVKDKTANLDGDIVNLGKETFDSIEIWLIVDGKCAEFSRYAPKLVTEQGYKRDYQQLKAKGVYARLGDTYIGEELYNIIISVIAETEAEFTTDAEYAEVKNAERAHRAKREALDKAEAEHYTKQIKNGLCPKCGTYCYGDCEATI